MFYEEVMEAMDEEQEVLQEIKQKKRKSKSKSINVMNKKRLSKWELDEYMVGFESEGALE